MNILKKLILFVAYLFVFIITLCSCSSQKEQEIATTPLQTVPQQDNTFTPFYTIQEQETENTARNAQEEAFKIEESAAQSRGAKEKELYDTLEDAEINLENAKQLNGEELQKVDFTDCSIAVLDTWNMKIYEWLSEEETENFINCIVEAEISSKEYGELPMFVGGNPGVFKIILNTGESIFVNALNFQDIHLLIINNKHGYACNEEVLTQLNKWYQDAVDRFHEKAWQS